MNTTVTFPEPARADIARLAYEKWEQQGRTSGKALDFWLEAEQQLLWIAKTKLEGQRADPFGGRARKSRTHAVANSR